MPRPNRHMVVTIPYSYGSLGEEHPDGTGLTTIECSVQNQDYPWITADEVEVTGPGYVTSDVAEASGDGLIIGVHGAGRYRADLASCFNGTASTTFRIGVYVNGVLSRVWFRRSLGTSAQTGSAADTNHIELVEGDVVTVCVRNETGVNRNFVIHKMSLVLERVGAFS